MMMRKQHRPTVVLQVGSEGGSLTLLGMQSGPEWKFLVTTDEATISDLLDLDDQIIPPVQLVWTLTWRAALKALDAYPWTELYPLYVHADFRLKVSKALQRRRTKGSTGHRAKWQRVLTPSDERAQKSINGGVGA